MLVMEIHWNRFRPLLVGGTGRNSVVYVLDRLTHWEFYTDGGDNIVLKARKDKIGMQEDLIFLDTLPKDRIMPVMSVSRGMMPHITTVIQEDRILSGEGSSDALRDVEVDENIKDYWGEKDASDTIEVLVDDAKEEYEKEQDD